MTLQAPLMLLLLLGVAAAVLGYVLLQRRRRHHAVRFANLDMLASVAPSRPGWRRHVTAGLALAAMAVLVVALAQPVLDREVARDQAIVVVALDVSLSMEATDVPPSRLSAAKQAATRFVEQLPAPFQVGVVAYGGTVQVVTAPTTDHGAAGLAIEGLTTVEGTATGEAIAASLDAIVTTLEGAGLAAGTPDVTTGLVVDGGPAADDDGPSGLPATIVLLSDGASADGRPVSVVAEQAAALGVPVSTITYGTPAGTIEVGGEVIAVPPDAASMVELAELTGGTAYSATSGDELAAVYDDVQAQVGTVHVAQDLTVAVVAVGFLLLLVSFGLGMLWSGRVF